MGNLSKNECVGGGRIFFALKGGEIERTGGFTFEEGGELKKFIHIHGLVGSIL